MWVCVYTERFIRRNWKLRVSGSAVGKLETQESWWCSSLVRILRTRKVDCEFQSESWQAWDPGRAIVSVQAQGRKRPMFQLLHSRRRCSLSLGLFSLFRPSTDRMRPTHMREGNLLHLEYDLFLNVNLIQWHVHRHTQNNVWPSVWAPCGPVKLTHKIKYHKLGPEEKDVGLT